MGSAAVELSARMRSLLTGPMRRESLDEETKKDLLLELDSDVHARSSVASQQSLLATWTRLHVRWFGGSSPPFPTWPLAVRAIASQMKLAGYRSLVTTCPEPKESTSTQVARGTNF